MHDNHMVIVCCALFGLHLLVTIIQHWHRALQSIWMVVHELPTKMVTMHMAVRSHGCPQGCACNCDVYALLQQLGVVLLRLYIPQSNGTALTAVTPASFHQLHTRWDHDCGLCPHHVCWSPTLLTLDCAC